MKIQFTPFKFLSFGELSLKIFLILKWNFINFFSINWIFSPKIVSNLRCLEQLEMLVNLEHFGVKLYAPLFSCKIFWLVQNSSTTTSTHTHTHFLFVFLSQSWSMRFHLCVADPTFSSLLSLIFSFPLIFFYYFGFILEFVYYTYTYVWKLRICVKDWK